MIGSREDEMCQNDMEKEYKELLSLVKNAETEMFDLGNHPLILTAVIKVLNVIKKYIKEKI